MVDTNTRAIVALHSDLPRIVRSDLTRVSEMIAKYRGLATVAPEAGLEDVEEILMQTRAELEGAAERIASASGAGGPIGPNPMQQDAVVISETGRPVGLTTILVQAGFVSKLAVAKKGIEGGHVIVDGKKAESVAMKLNLGEHRIECGAVTQIVKVE